MQCDLCGTETERLYITVVEGVNMNACEDCSKFGKVVRQIKVPLSEKKQMKEELRFFSEGRKETVFTIVDDYGRIVKQARERLGLKQEEFAKRLNEKESLLHNIESNHFEPSIDLARKLERLLKIELVEETEVSPERKVEKKTDSGGLTIGDMIKVKK